MSIITRKCTGFLVLLLLLFGLSTQLSFGYSFYIEKRCIGIVHNSAEAKAILDILYRETEFRPHETGLYIRLLPKSGYTPPAEVLENAWRAGGVTMEYLTESLSVPYETETVPDEGLYSGEEEIRTDGKPGVRTVVRRLYWRGGNVIKEELLSDTLTTPPVNRVIAKGMRPHAVGVGTGNFIFPLETVQVSSAFGSRWGRVHNGIDFAAESGANILAADAGTVIFSGTASGYGNLLILDHKNGLTSYYAHCSVLYAAVGATPEKGEVIAAVGSTGNSTGPHLHFEIRKQEVPEDPTQYLPDM